MAWPTTTGKQRNAKHRLMAATWPSTYWCSFSSANCAGKAPFGTTCSEKSIRKWTTYSPRVRCEKSSKVSRWVSAAVFLVHRIWCMQLFSPITTSLHFRSLNFNLFIINHLIQLIFLSYTLVVEVSLVRLTFQRVLSRWYDLVNWMNTKIDLMSNGFYYCRLFYHSGLNDLTW